MSNPSPFSTFPKNKNQIHFLIFRNPISLVGGIENIAASNHNSLPYYSLTLHTFSENSSYYPPLHSSSDLKMTEPVAFENDEELSLLSESKITVDRSWQLNFKGVQVSTDYQDKKPPRGLHDCCLGALGNFSTQSYFSAPRTYQIYFGRLTELL